MKPPHTANMDQAAAAWLRAATQATKVRASTFDRGPVGTVLRKAGNAADYRLADAAVPAKLFSSGPGGAETIAAYRKAAGPNAETFLHDAAAQSLNREAVRDGVLDPGRYPAWAAKHQDALRALPDALKAKFANVASASDALAQAAATRKAALEQTDRLFQRVADESRQMGLCLTEAQIDDLVSALFWAAFEFADTFAPRVTTGLVSNAIPSRED
jgi:hypothetical protein